MKTIKQLLPLLFLFILNSLSAQDPSAILDLESTDKGFLPPRMTTAQRDAITSPAEGMVIYNTSTGHLNVFSSGPNDWQALEPASSIRTINIPSLSFKPTRSTYVFDSGFGQGGCSITSPAFARLTAPLQLPEGARIIGFNVYYKDNDASAEMTIRLISELLTTGSFSTVSTFDTGVAFASNSWVGGSVSTTHVLLPERGYFIDVFSNGWGGDMRVKGVSITYVLPSN